MISRRGNAPEALGVELCEIENWQCCGGVFVTAKDEVASKLSSVRALKAARDASPASGHGVLRLPQRH